MATQGFPLNFVLVAVGIADLSPNYSFALLRMADKWGKKKSGDERDQFICTMNVRDFCADLDGCTHHPTTLFHQEITEYIFVYVVVYRSASFPGNLKLHRKITRSFVILLYLGF